MHKKIKGQESNVGKSNVGKSNVGKSNVRKSNVGKSTNNATGNIYDFFLTKSKLRFCVMK